MGRPGVTDTREPIRAACPRCGAGIQRDIRENSDGFIDPVWRHTITMSPDCGAKRTPMVATCAGCQVTDRPANGRAVQLFTEHHAHCAEAVITVSRPLEGVAS